MRIRERFNPRAPCGARPESSVFRAKHRVDISTHAPLAGRDYTHSRTSWRRREISTHAPLAGRDSIRCRVASLLLNFNPRAPCGARPMGKIRDLRLQVFQPTRPLRGATCFKF